MSVSPITFVKQSTDELKKVTWSTRQEVIRLSVAVMVISFAVGMFIGALDFIFTKILAIFVTR